MLSLLASASMASCSPRSVIWASPRLVTPAAALSIRGSIPSGRTIRWGLSSHTRLMWCMNRFGVTMAVPSWVSRALLISPSLRCSLTRCCRGRAHISKKFQALKTEPQKLEATQTTVIMKAETFGRRDGTAVPSAMQLSSDCATLSSSITQSQRH